MDAFTLRERYKNVTPPVEVLTSQQAVEYLSHNFDNNRDLRPAQVKKFINLIKEERFLLTNDAICFDEEGQLVNGQHRLTALKECNRHAAPFLVARNLPFECVEALDLGKVREMHERLNISGVDIEKIECAAVRHAMSSCGSQIGTQEYSEGKWDKLVATCYNTWKDYFELLAKKDLLSAHIPGYFFGAGLKIYAEMKAYPKAYPHGMTPEKRAIHAIEILKNGFADSYEQNNEYDAALVRVGRVKTDQPTGTNFLNAKTWKLVVSGSHNFMIGRSPQKLVGIKNDPFHSLISIMRE